jgi:hypothetical protein
MRAAYYERNGAARDVLRIGEIEISPPQPGEVQVRLHASGVNPSDVKSRAGLTRKIAFPRVIPHSDGAGVIDAIGEGVSPTRLGERVWIWNGQWRRALGTAAEAITLPSEQAVALPANVGMEAGASAFQPTPPTRRCSLQVPWRARLFSSREAQALSAITPYSSQRDEEPSSLPPQAHRPRQTWRGKQAPIT